MLVSSSSVETNPERQNGDGGPGSASKLRQSEPPEKEGEINLDNEAQIINNEDDQNDR